MKGEGIGRVVRVEGQHGRILRSLVGNGLQGGQDLVDGGGIGALLGAGKGIGSVFRRGDVLLQLENVLLSAGVRGVADGPRFFQRRRGVEGNAQHAGGNILILAGGIFQPDIPAVFLGVGLFPDLLAAFLPREARKRDAVHVDVGQENAHVGLDLVLGLPDVAARAGACDQDDHYQHLHQLPLEGALFLRLLGRLLAGVFSPRTAGLLLPGLGRGSVPAPALLALILLGNVALVVHKAHLVFRVSRKGRSDQREAVHPPASGSSRRACGPALPVCWRPRENRCRR